MDTDDPREQKRLGRLIEGFDEDTWNKVAVDVVTKGNFAKFSQNPEMKEWLLSTQDKILVEASPYDKIWGVGLREDDPQILDREQWDGTNWLGVALSNVRDMLRPDVDNQAVMVPVVKLERLPDKMAGHCRFESGQEPFISLARK